MADVMDGISTMGLGAMDTMSTIAVVMIYIAIVSVPILFIWNYLRFKHRVQIKKLTANGAIVYDDRAREVMQDGVKFWKLYKDKFLISCPPPDVTQMTKKGKLFVVCYFSEEMGYVWAKDTVTKDTFKAQTVDYELRNGEKVKVIRDVYQPFTTQERALQANQIRKAIERKGESLLAKIEKYLPFIMVFLMFVLVLIFWEDIAKPAITMSNANAEISKQNAVISEQNARILMMFGFDNITLNQQTINEAPPDVK
jgi:cell division protein FtsL